MNANLTRLFVAATAMSVISSALAQGAPPPPPPQGGGQQPPIPPHPGGGGQPPAPTTGMKPANRPPRPKMSKGSMVINPLQPKLGDPLPGLPADLLNAFMDGRDDFIAPEKPEGGLGPIFNRDSCVACHGGPAPGGSSPVNVTRFGTLTNGVFDPLSLLGGSLLQERSISPTIREVVPPQALIRAFRNSTPLFGLGLIEGIPDEAILAGVRVAPVDGVLGRACMITDVVSGQTRVGHFGWKAQQATVLAFAADAYLNEMGITNRFFTTENAPNGDAAKLAQIDHVMDPEDQIDPATGKGDVDKVADFMRLLGPPPAPPLSTSASQGRNVFNQVNCHLCHTPSMMTGPSAIGPLNNKVVNLFSDLLLHNMGALADRIAQGPANGNEMKTPPLWGLRASAPYLHDGRAKSVDAAIRAHDGEAKNSRNRYNALTPTQRQQLLDFLNSI